MKLVPSGTSHFQKGIIPSSVKITRSFYGHLNVAKWRGVGINFLYNSGQILASRDLKNKLHEKKWHKMCQ